jgi:hypothetical protein
MCPRDWLLRSERHIRHSALGISFFNNQPDALIIPILFCYRTLHLSSIFTTHHQEFSTVHSALPSRVRMERSSILTCLEAVIKACMKLTSAECTVENSLWWAEKMLERCRVLWQNKIGIISASGWLLKKKSFTMHGSMNITLSAFEKISASN